MKRVPLGKSGIEIAPIVFGGNVFGWTADQEQSFHLLDSCMDKGINMIDTADVYSAWAPGNRGGESERIMGEWFRQTGKRDQVVLATKVGMPLTDGSEGLSKKHIIEGAEASLRRLKTDYIDVFYAHKDDESVPFEETFSAFEQLIQQGKVRTIASSNYSADRLARALQFCKDNNLPQFIAHQPEYNLFDREGYEGPLENICKEFDLGVVTYFSLASGFLSGKYRNADDLKKSRRADFLDKYMTPRGLNILTALDDVASRYKVPAATVAIAWLQSRDTVTAPIVSATSADQLQQLCSATGLELAAADLQLLDDAGAE
ncbi:MAG: alcohol dehydrogenase [Oleibacter sp.]|nr:alcohol dehydrogenase [Thalassolituus sp.]|tara:strand:- start:266 stop:1216 length:951 start_codon:yes stop_codon:yes gene_type:complete